MRQDNLAGQFAEMTPTAHCGMKALLLKMAEEGLPKPRKNTILGYCLAKYTHKEFEDELSSANIPEWLDLVEYTGNN